MEGSSSLRSDRCYSKGDVSSNFWLNSFLACPSRHYFIVLRNPEQEHIIKEGLVDLFQD